MRKMAALVLSLALVACETADPLAADPQELEGTWLAGQVFAPGASYSALIGDPATLEKFARHYEGRRLPAVVYAHGCAGFGSSGQYDGRVLAEAGYMVFMPYSFGRKQKPRSCDERYAQGGFHRGVIPWRIAEVDHAVARIMALPYIDPERLALVGFSEGGTTVAQHPGDSFRARVILGWTCNSSYADWRGLASPGRQPVLAVVSRRDPWFVPYPGTHGHCGTFMSGPNQRSIVIDTPEHHVLPLPQVQPEVLAFLKAHLG